MRSYLQGTRHPWPSLFFLMPLLAAYEAGVLWLGGTHPESLRNGADSWLRSGLETVGLYHLLWPPLIVAAIFLTWTVARIGDRPQGLVSLFTGMVVESVVLALGLWWFARAMQPIMEQYVVESTMQVPSQQALGQVISFVGAGIYEEILFRLVLFTGLMWLCQWLWMPGYVDATLAALASGAVFSYAHHLPPNGEPFNNYVFLFRMAAGVYFAAVYRLRGFGVAVGTHALYDVLVGVVLE
jgi:membrane protease YdiL (CAAX protease family)